MLRIVEVAFESANFLTKNELEGQSGLFYAALAIGG
jgi:hypothetical protein